jgi:hypothetical protein
VFRFEEARELAEEIKHADFIHARVILKWGAANYREKQGD